MLNSKFTARLLILLISSIFVSSCISNKKVVYFQDKKDRIPFDSLINLSVKDYRLMEGDIIDVQVKSKDPSLSELFQLGSTANSNMMQGAQNGSDIFYLTGFTINSNGDIELPIVGEIYVEGMTLEEVRPIVKARIAEYIIDPYVEVKLGGVRFTALGEFNNPGRYGILQNDVTIFEAIANAGDITIMGDRKHAILIRQYPEGERMHELDLTDRKLMTSPYYYVQPNDLLYVAPLKVRALGTGVTGFQTFTTIITTITGIVLIVGLFR